MSIFYEELVGSFRNEKLLQLALTHSSIVNEVTLLGETSNERMEFLGDSVVGLVVAKKLYEANPDADEGYLSRSKSNIVSGKTLSGVAVELGIDKALSLGVGEDRTGGRNKQSNLAAGFEAVVGAIFLDRGWEAAERFVLDSLAELIVCAQSPRGTIDDPKTELQQISHSMTGDTPFYRVSSKSGLDHAPTFTVEVLIGDLVYGIGSGVSKRVAEKEAAFAALNKFRGS